MQANTTQPLMITVAPTGARVNATQFPNTPITPKAIATEVIECAKLGASIAHLHARDSLGNPTQSIEIFREIVDRIRDKSDIVIQLSLGTKGMTVEQAIEPITLDVEMGSLPLSAFEGGDTELQDKIVGMSAMMSRHGIKPEMAIYGSAMMTGALRIIGEGATQAPHCFGLILGDPPSLREGVEKLLALSALVPKHSFWWAAKGGAHQLALKSLAMELGGHVRVGFEDSPLDFRAAAPAPSNAALVDQMAQLALQLGKTIATPQMARETLGLRAPKH